MLNRIAELAAFLGFAAVIVAALVAF